MEGDSLSQDRRPIQGECFDDLLLVKQLYVLLPVLEGRFCRFLLGAPTSIPNTFSILVIGEV